MTSNPYAKKFGASSRQARKDSEAADLYSFDPAAAANDLIAATIGANNGGNSGAASSGNAPGFGYDAHAALASQRQTQAGGPGGPMGVGGGDGPRPMTSARGAGYTSTAKKAGGAAMGAAFDPLGQSSTLGPARPLEQRSHDSPEHAARDMEREVNKKIEASAFAAQAKNHALALEEAKAAAKLERALCKHREDNKLRDQINYDLTYAVCFNLANCFAQSKLYTEALSTYALVVKNKQYPQSGRLRVNMGNIYALQRKYPAAIKMYRMAMDQIGAVSRSMRFKIMRNIGLAFVKMGQYQDAVHSFESIADQAPDAQSAFNLVVCYYALGEKEKMRKGFLALLNVPEYAQQEQEDEEEAEAAIVAAAKAKSAVAAAQSAGAPLPDKLPSASLLVDELKAERKARRKLTHRYLHMAARLIAPVLEKDLAQGFDWVIEQLKAPRAAVQQGGNGLSQSQQHSIKPSVDNTSTHAQLVCFFVRGCCLRARSLISVLLVCSRVCSWVLFVCSGFPSISMELEIAKGIAFLRRRHLTDAIEVFKSFETRDQVQGCLDQAATNLAFLYFLEGDLKSSGRYAELAVKADRYNAKALVNKANVLYSRGELEQAKELYLEAIGVEADCVEAIYNLGLANKKMGLHRDALQAFKKLHRILPRDAEVVWHMANLHELMGDRADAITLFNTLHSRVPSDAKVLARIGTLYTMEGDDREARGFFKASFDTYPVSMDVISWLGVWHVKAGAYEKDEYAEAIEYFERASEIEPGELKWKLMVASCWRRMDKLDRALAIYKAVHRADPDNVECLRYLCTICHDTNDKDYEEYAALFRKAERAAQIKAAEIAAQQQGANQGYMRGESGAQGDGSPHDGDGHPRAPDVSPGNTSRALGGGSAARQPINHADGFKPELSPAKQGPTFSVGQGGNDEWGEGLGDELLP